MVEYVKKTDAILAVDNTDYHGATAGTWAAIADEAVGKIGNLPAEDVRPIKHGRWIKSLYQVRCNKCGAYSDKMTRFCPDCGAEMTE